MNRREPNFMNDKGKWQLVRCYACKPNKGRRNEARFIGRGKCAHCGWRFK